MFFAFSQDLVQGMRFLLGVIEDAHGLKGIGGVENMSDSRRLFRSHFAPRFRRTIETLPGGHFPLKRCPADSRLFGLRKNWLKLKLIAAKNNFYCIAACYCY